MRRVIGHIVPPARGWHEATPVSAPQSRELDTAQDYGWAGSCYSWAFTTTTGKLPNTSASERPRPPSMNTDPPGPKVGLPPGLTPTKAMALVPLPPWMATSKANVAVAALGRFTSVG